jgi:O-antigen/teichoic acid export membrane protein
LPGGVASGLTDAISLGLSAVVSAVLSVVCLRTILDPKLGHASPAAYASYSTFLVVTNFAIVFLSWPAWSVLRLGADELHERHRLGRTLGLHLLLLGASLAVVAPPIWIFRDTVLGFIRAPVLPLVIGYAATTALGQVLAAHLKPGGRVSLFGALPVITRVLYLALLLLWSKPLDGEDLALVITVTAAPQVLIALAGLGRTLERPRAPRPGDVRRAIGFGLPVMLRNLGVSTLQYLNIIVIRKLLSADDEVAHYQVAASVGEQIAVLGVAAESLMGPILARAAARGDEKTVGTYYRVLAPQVVLLWGIGIAIAMVVARPVLGHLLRAHNVEASARVLEVLLLATSLRIVSSLEAPVLDAHLESRAPLGSFLVRLATNLGLALLFVNPRLWGWGIDGAAWATVAAAWLGGAVQTFWVARRFSLPAFRLYLYVAPAVGAFAWARTRGGASSARDAAVGAGIVVAALVVARVAGVFSPRTLEALSNVRMPDRLRRALAFVYGANPP